MTGLQGRSRGRVVAAGAAVVLLAPLALAACSSGDGSSVATTTTVDPLAGPALDACGNDLSTLSTTVRGIDPATGAVRWTTAVPLVEHYLLRSEAGNPQLPLQARSVEVELDRTTGQVVAYPPAGAHEVVVDVSNRWLSVDGDIQPDAPVVGGLTLSTGYGATVDGAPRLVATDASGATVWELDLGAGGTGGTGVPAGSVSRATVFGDVVVVTASPPEPSCGPQG